MKFSSRLRYELVEQDDMTLDTKLSHAFPAGFDNRAEESAIILEHRLARLLKLMPS